VCCRVVCCVAVCCSVLQSCVLCCSVCRWSPRTCDMTHSYMTWLNSCSVLQCVTVCCSVLQCVAVCCSVLCCVAVYAGNHSLLGMTHLYDTTYWYVKNKCLVHVVRHESFMSVTWFIHVCDVTYLYVWHDSLVRNMTYAYVTWLIHIRFDAS